eukprot:2777994-Rhodomonas_salina.1
MEREQREQREKREQREQRGKSERRESERDLLRALGSAAGVVVVMAAEVEASALRRVQEPAPA